MSDSSSVDRWHPSNVEDKRIDINDGIVWRDAEGRDWVQANRFREKVARIEELEQMRRTLHANHEYKDARIAELEADRGRVLAAVEKRVEGLRLVPPNVGYGDGWQDYNSAIDDALNAIKSSSSSSTEEREV